jgi:hypothetical protein
MSTSGWKVAASALAWILLSPFAVLFVLMANEQSPVVFYTHLIGFGAWTIAGVIAGIGTIASWRWTRTLKALLAWIAFAYFSIAAILMLWFVRARMAGMLVAVMVFGTGLPFLVIALRQRIEPATGDLT